MAQRFSSVLLLAHPLECEVHVGDLPTRSRAGDGDGERRGHSCPWLGQQVGQEEEPRLGEMAGAAAGGEGREVHTLQKP